MIISHCKLKNNIKMFIESFENRYSIHMNKRVKIKWITKITDMK